MTEQLLLVLANGFIVLYLVHAWTWDLPKEFSAKRMVWWLRPLVLWLGLWHTWKMFAPRPVRSNAWIRIEIIRPGREPTQLKILDFEEMSCWQAFLNVRERKYQECLANDAFQFHRRGFCDFYRHRQPAEFADAAEIKLLQFKAPIPFPGTESDSIPKRIELLSCGVNGSNVSG